ncbi:MAG: helix-turn-helix transcriptional regulator [Atopobiaceae bacterium]|nr:helix-turn-helix transcriptional regulator [Atopobiaceae bacterium]
MGGLVERYRRELRPCRKVTDMLDRLLRSKEFSIHGMDEHTAEIVERIERECSTITAFQLARELGYNESYFSQLMRARTGLTSIALITNARMRKARTLLSETDLSVTDVAREVGYQGYSHFHKLYTRTFGVTPAMSRDFLQLSQ